MDYILINFSSWFYDSCTVFFFFTGYNEENNLKDKIIKHKEMRTKICSWRMQVSCKRTRMCMVRRLQGRLMAIRSNVCCRYPEIFFFHPLTLLDFYLATMHLIFDFKQQNEMKQFQEEHERCMVNWENGLVGGSDLRMKRTLHRRSQYLSKPLTDTGTKRLLVMWNTIYSRLLTWPLGMQ